MPGSLEVLERANTRPDGGGSGGDGDKEAKKERRTFHCLLCQSGSLIITAKSPSYHSTPLSIYCTRCCPVELLLRTFFNHCQKSDVGCDWHHAKLVAGNFPLHPLALKYAPIEHHVVIEQRSRPPLDEPQKYQRNIPSALKRQSKAVR